MVGDAFHHPGFAGAATAHRAGIIDVDAGLDQRSQNGLARRNRDRAAAAAKLNLKTTNRIVRHCMYPFLACMRQDVIG